MSERDDALITVGNYWSATEAHLARNRLQAAGIRSVVSDEFTATMNWDLSNAIRGIKLQVLATDAERADAILNESEGETESIPDDPELNEAREDDSETDEPEEQPSPPASLAEPEDDQPEKPWNDREKLADRVYRGAIFGLLMWPLQFWVFILLIRMFLRDDPLRPELKRKAVIGACINLPMTALTGFLFPMWLRASLFS